VAAENDGRLNGDRLSGRFGLLTWRNKVAGTPEPWLRGAGAVAVLVGDSAGGDGQALGVRVTSSRTKDVAIWVPSAPAKVIVVLPEPVMVRVFWT